MPLHRIYAPAATFSSQDKAEISQRITTLYTSRTGFPAFYVVVLFIDVPEESFYVGGKPTANFVRIVTQHFARSTPKELQFSFMDDLGTTWEPYIKDRGLDWEVHVEEQGEKELWRPQGLVAPPPHSEVEKEWARENRAVPYY